MNCMLSTIFNVCRLSLISLQANDFSYEHLGEGLIFLSTVLSHDSSDHSFFQSQQKVIRFLVNIGYCTTLKNAHNRKFQGPFGGQDMTGHDMIVIISCCYLVFDGPAGQDNTILSLILSCLSCVKVILRGDLGQNLS